MRPMTVVSDTPLTPREKKVLSGALTRAGIPSSSVTLTHVCPQTNYTAFRAAKSRAGFLAALGAPVVIVPLGSDALYNLMGLRPATLYRGLLPPSWATDIELGPETHSPTHPSTCEWVIPTLHPRVAWNAGAVYTIEADLERARRALTGELHIVGGAG